MIKHNLFEDNYIFDSYNCRNMKELLNLRYNKIIYNNVDNINLLQDDITKILNIRLKKIKEEHEIYITKFTGFTFDEICGSFYLKFKYDKKYYFNFYDLNIISDNLFYIKLRYHELFTYNGADNRYSLYVSWSDI